MLPAIKRHAELAFRHLDPEARADAVEEVIANALVAFVQLVRLGKADVAYATPLAMFGVRQFRAGRRVGNKLNVRDVTSRHCQLAKGIHVGRLDHRDEDTGLWREILIEDRHAGPAETAAARIDISDWMAILPARLRHMAEVLATGESTKAAARQFQISPARISQIRRELMECWGEFQGEARGVLAVA
jgi:hypothetical protein